MSVEGRAYSVDTYHTIRLVPPYPLTQPFLSPVPNYLTATVETVLAIHRDQPAGDIVAFLTGQVYA